MRGRAIDLTARRRDARWRGHGVGAWLRLLARLFALMALSAMAGIGAVEFVVIPWLAGGGHG
jgi:hypothetical protein